MNILLTNDDGIMASGLRAIYHALKKAGHNVLTVAPNLEKSATSQAITVSSPLKVYPHIMSDGAKAFAVDGTPADCVLLGLSALAKNSIDIVLSGINNGPNLGYDINYSGTVAAAVEAACFGYKSLAASFGWPKPKDGLSFTFADYLLAKKRQEKDFQVPAEIVLNILTRWDSFQLSEQAALNLNIPDLPISEIMGERWIHLEGIPNPDIFKIVKTEGQTGAVFYQRSRSTKRENSSLNADERIFAEGFVTLTPVLPKLACGISLEKNRS